MGSRTTKIAGLGALLLITIVAGILTAGAAETTRKEVLFAGQLLSERCLAGGKLSACYIESAADSRVVLFTGDRKLYHLELGRAPQWKIDSAFGKQVVMKGTLEGSKILVNDVAALGGKKKLSKACL